MNKSIKVGSNGKILNGKRKNWYLYIEDDKKNTGGYLVFIFDKIDSSIRTEIYDYWAENLENLDSMFKEFEWEVQWYD